MGDSNTLVGLVCGASTGTVYAIINPDEDSELDNPRWLLIKMEAAQREPLTLIRITLADYMACTSLDAVVALAKKKL